VPVIVDVPAPAVAARLSAASNARLIAGGTARDEFPKSADRFQLKFAGSPDAARAYAVLSVIRLSSTFAASVVRPWNVIDAL